MLTLSQKNIEKIIYRQEYLLEVLADRNDEIGIFFFI